MTELIASLGWSYPAVQAVIPPMSAASIEKVRRWTEQSLQNDEQYPFITEHLLWAGQYFRTVHIPAPAEGDVSRVTGVLVKIPTVLTICGDVIVYMGEGLPPRHVRGLERLRGSAGRKQAFLSRAPYTMQMSFATNAETVAAAQAEFTDEIEFLCPLSETDRHVIIMAEEVT